MRSKKYLFIHLIYREPYKLCIAFCVSVLIFLLLKDPQRVPLRLRYVTVHFDLKGAPLRMKYFLSILPHLKNLGANSLLMEYEDMFPYEGRLENISTPMHYTKTELETFLKTASKLDLEIIPLVQTYNQMEHVLKLEEFSHLREDHKFPDTIRLNDPNGLDVISQMLKQIINFHSNFTKLKHIHIGCKNETMHACSANLTHDMLNHMIEVSRISKEINPELTVLIWDDYFRGNSLNDDYNPDIEEMTNYVQVIYLDSTPMLTNKQNKILNFYHRAFKNVWVASGYKGADANETIAPDLERRFLNNLHWLNFMHNYIQPGTNVTKYYKGMILTGFSRKNHFAPLLELFPNSVLSLTSNLMLIQKYQSGVPNIKLRQFKIRQMYTDLKRRYWNEIAYKLSLCDNNVLVSNAPICKMNTFAINVLNRVVDMHFVLIERIKNFGNPIKYQAFDYNHKAIVRDKYHNCTKLNAYSERIKNSFKDVLLPFYDNYVIHEFIEYTYFHENNILNNCEKVLKQMYDKEIWSNVRMLPDYSDFEWERDFNRKLIRSGNRH